MTDFSTPCCTNARFSRCLWRWLLLVWLAVGAALVPAQSVAPATEVERTAEGLWVSAQLDLKLPSDLEDALRRGVPMVFVTQARVQKERWYWWAKTLVSAQRTHRLVYLPLTQRWRLVRTDPQASTTGLGTGLVLSQTFESLEDAWRQLLRIQRWWLADAQTVAGSGLVLHLSFELDTASWPRPLQLGGLTGAQEAVSLQWSVPLPPESAP